MGSCVSAHRDPESVMKVRISFGSKADKLVIPSPIKDSNSKLVNSDRPIAAGGLKPQSFRDFGSKEETFFDSQAWLDSDCDDDFLSVNGDFTPSRGNTPVHHNFSAGTPKVNKTHFGEQAPGPNPESSPTDKKKRLSELFKESLRNDEEDDEQTTPYIAGVNSVSSSERAPSVDSKPLRTKSVRSVQCCLPSLLSSRSFSERKEMSPAHSNG